MGFIFNWMCLKKTTFKDENLDLSSVKFVMPMGSTVPESLCEDLQKFMTGMQFVYHIYGMTKAFKIVSR